MTSRHERGKQGAERAGRASQGKVSRTRLSGAHPLLAILLVASMVGPSAFAAAPPAAGGPAGAPLSPTAPGAPANFTRAPVVPPSVGPAIAVIAAIAIPPLIEARKGTNEAAAIGALRTMATAQSLFREGDKDKNGILDYAQSLGMLGNTSLIDNQLATGLKQGYAFRILPEMGLENIQFNWSATATPTVPGTTGDRSFFVDERGVIRWAPCGTPTKDSPPLGEGANETQNCPGPSRTAHGAGVGALSELNIISNGSAVRDGHAALSGKDGAPLASALLAAHDLDGDQALSFQEVLMADPSLLGPRLDAILPPPTSAGNAVGATSLSPQSANAPAASSTGAFDVFTDVYRGYANAMLADLQLGAGNEVVNFTVDLAKLGAGGADAAASLMDDVPSLDHFKCYGASGPSVHTVVFLQDEFDVAAKTSETVKVLNPTLFCNPAAKTAPDGTVSAIANADGHLTAYNIEPVFEGQEATKTVVLRNQLGWAQVVTVREPQFLLVPSQKLTVDGVAPATGGAAPEGLDHFKCYQAAEERAPGFAVTLQDQFDAAANTATNVTVGKLQYVCNPTRKIHHDFNHGITVAIGDAGGHLACYAIEARADSHKLTVANQFGANQSVTTRNPSLLCVPSILRVPRPNPDVILGFDALRAEIRGLLNLTHESVRDTLNRIADAARDAYTAGSLCGAKDAIRELLNAVQGVRSGATDSSSEGGDHDDDGADADDNGQGEDGDHGGGDGKDGGNGEGGGRDTESVRADDPKDDDEDEDAAPSAEIAAQAEALYNRALTLYNSFFDSFFDVFFDVFISASPCFDATVGMAPQLTILKSDNTTFAAGIAFGAPRMWTVVGGGETFTQLEVPGLQSLSGVPGLPAIPYWRGLVGVPNGADAVLSQPPEPDKHADPVHLNLYPTQAEASDAAVNDNSSANDNFTFVDPPFVKDAKAYAMDRFFPPDPCMITTLGVYRDLKMAQVICAAGQYNPVTQELRRFDSLSFEVDFHGGNGTFLTSQSQSVFESAPSLYKSSALNHAALDRYVSAVDISQLTCQGEELLILTHPDFRSAADNLSTWKESKGIATTVIEVGDDTTYDTADKIDALIEHRYDTCAVRPSYVLLFGDAEFVPPSRTDWNTSLGGGGGDPTTGSDWGYAVYVQILFDAFFPDFAVARIPVDTAAQADTVVSKIVGYESSPPDLGFGSGGPFYTTAAFPSHFQCCRMNTDGTPISMQPGTDQRAFVETAELARAQLLAGGKSVQRIYTETVDGGGYCTAAACPPGAVQSAYSGSTTPNRYLNGALLPSDLRAGSGFAWTGSTADIIAAINQGRFLVFHRDHGAPWGWGNPGFSTGNLGSLNNSGMLPVVYSVNCASGFWDQETDGSGSGESFMEQMLTMSGGGMVGGLGDNRNSPTWANNALSRGFFDATWTNTAPEFGGSTPIRRLGDILNHGKMYLLTQIGVAQTAGAVDLNSALAELIMWHAFGDPTLEMWTSNPHKLTLSTVFELAQHKFSLDVSYATNGSTITAFLSTEDGLVPYGRAQVVNGTATIEAFNPGPDPPSPENLVFSASLPDSVSVVLAQSSITPSSFAGAPPQKPGAAPTVGPIGGAISNAASPAELKASAPSIKDELPPAPMADPLSAPASSASVGLGAEGQGVPPGAVAVSGLVGVLAAAAVAGHLASASAAKASHGKRASKTRGRRASGR